MRLYHDAENKKSEDPLEGYSVIFYDDFCLTSISGLNYYITCGTDISESHKNCSYMQEQYGTKILKIDIHGFAKEIQKTIGAKSYSVRKIKYSTLKLCRFNSENTKVIYNNELFFTEQLYDLVKKDSFLPSIFCKPLNYEKESEIRIAFEMDEDVQNHLTIKNLDFLKWIEVIK